MKKLGVLIHKIKNSNIYLLHVGWGKIKYFITDNNLGTHYYDKYNVYSQAVVLYDDDEESDLSVVNIEPIKNYENIGKLHSEWESSIYDYEFEKAIEGNPELAVIPSKFVAFTDKHRLFRQNLFDSTRYSSIDIDDKSEALLYLLFGKNYQDSPSEIDFLNSYLKAKCKVENYDLETMVENVKVYVHRISHTRRGSDNYLVANHSLKTDYGYEEDAFLDKFLPHESSSLLDYDEKDDYWIDQTRKLSYLEEEELAKKRTFEIRAAAKNIVKSQYNRDEHISTLMFMELYGSIYSKGRKYLNCQKKLDKINGIANAIWFPENFEDNISFYKLTSENYIEWIKNHNKFFIAKYLL